MITYTGTCKCHVQHVNAGTDVMLPHVFSYYDWLNGFHLGEKNRRNVLHE